jgi:hypothetical protein
MTNFNTEIKNSRTNQQMCISAWDQTEYLNDYKRTWLAIQTKVILEGDRILCKSEWAR